MKTTSRLVRRVFLWFAALVALLVVVAAMASLLVFTETGSRWLAAWAAPLLPETVTFEKFEGTLAGPLELWGLEYSDAGERVRVERLWVSWHPRSIWERIIQLDSVNITGALVVWGHDSTTAEVKATGAKWTTGHQPASSWQVTCRILSVAGAVIEAPYGITLHDLQGTAQGRLDAYRVSVASALTIDTLSGLRFACAGRGDLAGFKLDELSFGRDSSRLEVQGELAWTPEVSWSLALNAHAIDPSAWIPQLDSLRGSVRITGHSTGKLTDTAPEYDVVVDTVEGMLRGAPVSARAAMRVRGGRVEIDSSAVFWSGLSAFVNGVYDDSVNLTWHVSSPDLSLLYAEFAGAIQAEGEARGSLDSLQLTAGFAGRGLAFGDHKAGALEGEVRWRKGGVEASDLSLFALQVETDGLQLDSLRLAATGTRSSHKATLVAAGPRGDMSVSVVGRYDSSWQAEVRSVAVNSAQAGTWHLSSPARWTARAGVYSLEDLCLEGERGRVCLSGDFRSGREWDVQANLSEVSSEALAFLLPPDYTVTTTLDGDVAIVFDPQSGISASSQISMSPGRVVHAVTGDSVQTDTLSVLLDWSPVSGRLTAGGGWGLEGDSTRFVLDLELPGTTQVKDELDQDTSDWVSLPWSGSFSIQPLSLQMFDRFLPANMHLEGQASVQAQVSTHSGRRLEGVCTVELPPGSMLLVPEEDTLVLNWSASRLELRADSVGITARAATDLSTPGHAVGDMAFELTSTDPIEFGRSALDLLLQGSVRGQLDLAALQPFVTKLSGLQGTLDVNTTFRGTPRDLSVEGSLELTAEAFVQELGIQLTDIRLSMLGEGEQVAVSGGMTSGEGRLEISGTLSRLPSRESPSRWRVQGDKFLVFESREASIWISPELEVVMAGDSLDVSGSIQVPRARVEVVKLPEQAVAPSADIVMVGDTLPAAGSKNPIWVRVQVTLGDDVFFKGFDLSSYLYGSIETRQRPGSDMEGRGELRLREGRYRGYGQDLQVDPGRFIFSGPLYDPALDVLAYRRASDNTKAGFKISGTLALPKIDLYSDPYRTENDIMSYVLFGRAASEGSESDRMKATQAAAIMGGNVLAAQAASQIGLDEARIDPGKGRNDAALVAGMYLSPQLFVGYGTGLFETLHTLRVRYIVSKHISLEAETGTRETADILYQIERGD